MYTECLACNKYSIIITKQQIPLFMCTKILFEFSTVSFEKVAPNGKELKKKNAESSSWPIFILH